MPLSTALDSNQGGKKSPDGKMVWHDGEWKPVDWNAPKAPGGTRAAEGEKAANVGIKGQNYWEALGKSAQGELEGAKKQAGVNAGQLNQQSAIEQYYQQLQGQGSQYFNQARKDSMGNLSQLYNAQGAFDSGANLAANAKAQSNLAAQEEQWMGGLAGQATNAQQGRLGQAFNQQHQVGNSMAGYGMQAGQGAIGAWTEGQHQQIAAAMAQINRGEAVSDQDKQLLFSIISSLFNGAGSITGTKFWQFWQ